MIISIDPGSEKCGIAVLNTGGEILEKNILPRELFSTLLPFYLSKYGISTVVIGQGSFGRKLEKELLKLKLRANFVFISEKFSTLEARRRYWKENKPKGLLRFIPTSLLFPPAPIDDYAAVILGERYLKG